jgi:hypothetical protein
MSAQVVDDDVLKNRMYFDSYNLKRLLSLFLNTDKNDAQIMLEINTLEQHWRKQYIFLIKDVDLERRGYIT